MAIKWFAIVKDVDGSLVSEESTESTERLSDFELQDMGLVRVTIPGPLLITHKWNSVTRVQEIKPVPGVSANETLRLSLIALDVTAGMTAKQLAQSLQLIIIKMGKIL